MSDLKNINDAIMSLNESDLLHVIPYRNKNNRNNNNRNVSILSATVKFIKDTEWFDQPFSKLLLKQFLFIHSYPFKFFFKNPLVGFLL